MVLRCWCQGRSASWKYNEQGQTATLRQVKLKTPADIWAVDYLEGAYEQGYMESFRETAQSGLEKGEQDSTPCSDEDSHAQF